MSRTERAGCSSKAPDSSQVSDHRVKTGLLAKAKSSQSRGAQTSGEAGGLGIENLSYPSHRPPLCPSPQLMQLLRPQAVAVLVKLNLNLKG